MKSRMLLCSLLLVANGLTVNVAKAQNAIRMVGYSHSLNNGAIYVSTDSVSANYSNGRGSDVRKGYSLGKLNFDTLMNWHYNNAANAFIKSSRQLRTYNGNNQVTNETTQNWVLISGTWVNATNSVYSYTGNNLTTYIMQTWDAASNSFLNSSKNVYLYDANNNLGSSIYQTWNAATTSWTNISKNVYTYDSVANQLTNISQTWNAATASWTNISKTTNVFAAPSTLISVTGQGWDSVGMTWMNNTQRIYTYDSVNDPILNVSTTWNAGSSTWTNSTKDIYIYNNTHDRIDDIAQTWDAASTNWMNVSRTMYTYDNNHNQTSMIFSPWNNAATAFVSQNRTRGTYNTYNQPTMWITDTWNNGGFWEPTTTDYEDRYTYEAYTTGVAQVENNNNSVQLFPVPANNTLNVTMNWETAQSAVVTILDVQGRVWKQWQTATATELNQTVSVNDMPNGTYFVRVAAGNTQVVKSISVIH
jgi:Secretion system C-terminal sorting domain